MKRAIMPALGVLSLIGVIIFASSTNPAELHPVGILLFFILLYVSLAVFFTLFVFYGSRILKSVYTSIFAKRGSVVLITMRRAYLYGTVLALAPIIFLAMYSVGSTGVLDIALVVLFETIALLYVWKRA